MYILSIFLIIVSIAGIVWYVTKKKDKELLKKCETQQSASSASTADKSANKPVNKLPMLMPQTPVKSSIIPTVHPAKKATTEQINKPTKSIFIRLGETLKFKISKLKTLGKRTNKSASPIKESLASTPKTSTESLSITSQSSSIITTPPITPKKELIEKSVSSFAPPLAELERANLLAPRTEQAEEVVHPEAPAERAEGVVHPEAPAEGLPKLPTDPTPPNNLLK